MALIRAFRGIRPKKEYAKQMASRPYDVVSTEEARAEAADNPWSFFHIIRSEIDLPDGTDPYDQSVYDKARETFLLWMKKGALVQDKESCLYVYQQVMNGRRQTGLMACSAIDDYFNDVIRKHEFTRPEKEQDRIRHIHTVQAHSEPVFLTYPKVGHIDAIINTVVNSGVPEYDFTAPDKIQHTLWVVRDKDRIQELVRLFSDRVPCTYIADGHHRAASSARVGMMMRENNPKHKGTEEYNFFMTCLFPSDQLFIMDYNRLVLDLNGMTPGEFLQKLSAGFTVEQQDSICKPTAPHQFGMCLEGKWYSLSAKSGTYDDKDPIGVLDVTILQNNVMDALLGIKDPRTDKRIDFVGGIRGLTELEIRVKSGGAKAAFALYPVSIRQLIAIADTGNVMPPKSTWFEPKLRSGLIIHSLNGK